MKIRKAYDKRDRFAVVFHRPSRAKQSFKDECDINRIMAKYAKTGLVDHVNEYQGQYGGLGGEIDYQSDLNAVIAAQEAFASLPAGIRTRFNNNPAEFLGFVENPDNEAEMIEMGLRTARPVETPAEPSDGQQPTKGPPQGEEKAGEPTPPEKAIKAPSEPKA